MAMTEDMSAFFNTSEHAETAIYKTQEIDGIFENQYVEVNGVQSLKPTFLIDDESVPTIKRGNALRIKDIEYSYIHQQSDGTGVTLLILEVVN